MCKKVKKKKMERGLFPLIYNPFGIKRGMLPTNIIPTPRQANACHQSKQERGKRGVLAGCGGRQGAAFPTITTYLTKS
jgi:hypothetical protein